MTTISAQIKPKLPLGKKSTCNEEDGTVNNPVSTYTDSVPHASSASNTCSGGKRKGSPLRPLTDAIVPSDSDDEDYEEVNELVDAAVLSKNNPTDGKKASAEVLKNNSYERSFYDVISLQCPRRSSAIWKYKYFKELHINQRGKRILSTERKLLYWLELIRFAQVRVPK
jgi:hypothetical protein